MRKILKGIITSVFALSLILPTTVTMVYAGDTTVSPYNNATNSLSVITSGNTVNADVLFDAVILTGLPKVVSGETLTVDLTGVTVNGGVDFASVLSGTSKKIKILGGTFILDSTSPSHPDTAYNNVGKNISITHKDVTFDGTTIIDSGCTNGEAVWVNGSISNINLNNVKINCATGKDGILATGNIKDLNINNVTITGTSSKYPIKIDGSNTIEKVNIINGTTIQGTFSQPVDFTGDVLEVFIDGSNFYGQCPGVNPAIKSYADSNMFKVTNNDFKNCSYAVGVLSSCDSRKNLAFNTNKLNYNGPNGSNDTVPGVREYITNTANLSPNNQATHNYSHQATAWDDSTSKDYWFAKTTSTVIPPTTTYPFLPYYPTTTTTPATKVDDPFVYVFKDTPITTPVTTTTPTTTTDTTSRRNRTDGTTRSSRNANAVINASNKTLVSGSSFNFKEGVTAFDNGGNGDTLTNKVTVTGSINTQKAGTYPITYKVTGANGVAVTKVVTVTVKAK